MALEVCVLIIFSLSSSGYPAGYPTPAQAFNPNMYAASSPGYAPGKILPRPRSTRCHQTPSSCFQHNRLCYVYFMPHVCQTEGISYILFYLCHSPSSRCRAEPYGPGRRSQPSTITGRFLLHLFSVREILRPLEALSIRRKEFPFYMEHIRPGEDVLNENRAPLRPLIEGADFFPVATGVAGKKFTRLFHQHRQTALTGAPYKNEERAHQAGALLE